MITIIIEIRWVIEGGGGRKINLAGSDGGVDGMMGPVGVITSSIVRDSSKS